MKKIAIVIAIVIAVIGIGFNSPAAASRHKHKHVPYAVCATMYQHPHSAKGKQCQRQGWWYTNQHFWLNGDYVHAMLAINPHGVITYNVILGVTNPATWGGQPTAPTPDPVIGEPDFSGGCGMCMDSGTTPVIP